MLILFRTDASLEIGSGHVMRCLALADGLAAKGIECQFICRAHEGNLINFICSRGYVTHILPLKNPTNTTSPSPQCNHLNLGPSHQHWLGTTQIQDAEICIPILAKKKPNWLIVDHYSINNEWENLVKPYSEKLMVIDDLADRPHNCDLLLDQNLCRHPSDYQKYVSSNSKILVGPEYALLRQEFSALRTYSLARRSELQFKKLLITMGGIDKDNITGKLLLALSSCHLPQDCAITVVMGLHAPWIAHVQEMALTMPWRTDVRINVHNMAELMAESDIAIGASGSTAWERCCLGLPSLVISLAENQSSNSKALEAARLAIQIPSPAYEINHQRTSLALSNGINKIIENYPEISSNCAKITSGTGVKNLINFIINHFGANKNDTRSITILE